MLIFRQLDAIPADFGPTVVSIGNFDGVHRAHQHVLRENIRRARELGAKSLIVTFDPHPVRILRPDVPKHLITPLPLKLRILEQLGFDAVLVLTFNRDLSLMTPRQFANEVLMKRLHVIEIHEGSNFHFGHHQEGNVEKLAELGRELGFHVHIYPQRYYRGEHVSSSRIRALISEGKVSRARALLARPFSILSTPGRGRGYGHRYTVPTINLSRYDELVPAHGVYITTTRVYTAGTRHSSDVGAPPFSAREGGSEGRTNESGSDRTHQASNPASKLTQVDRALAPELQAESGQRIADSAPGETFDSVTNVGLRPTFENESFAIETHLLNFHPIALQPDTEVEIAFLQRLRPEIKFPTVDDLRAQIAKDVHKARRYFHLCSVVSTVR
jgi:riboflavin kinase / FMN adenylyltransferase